MRLKSLLLVEERLAEARYWADELGSVRGSTFGYNLNAFLSAARSVTFLLQKEFASVPGFSGWWDDRRRELGRDEAARLFLELRNYSQKEGRVSVHGASRPDTHCREWDYWFAGGEQPVPESLLYRRVPDCCREHVAKLARVVLAAAVAFPFHSCPSRALTIEGANALGLNPEDIEQMLGFSPGWTQVDGFSPADRWYSLSRHFDAVDFAAIRELADWKSPEIDRPGAFTAGITEELETLRSKLADMTK